MSYVGNLLDWADSLFTQFTMETVNEALMLYIMASDILGPRPAELGDCGAGDTPITYNQVEPLLDGPGDDSDDFLVLAETWTIGAQMSKAPTSSVMFEAPLYAIDQTGIHHAVARNPLAPAVTKSIALPVKRAATAATQAAPARAPGMFLGLDATEMSIKAMGPALGNATTKTLDTLGGASYQSKRKGDFADRAGRYGHSVVRQIATAFCVPVNADLLALWDRVEDRLYKIRHCMNINGELQQLALFAPPINPMQLVAMQAEGLSLDDVLGSTNGDLPPYRFLYLIDRAKAHAAAVSGFGAALLSSLEKKDGEQMNRLRLTQQMNLAQMTTQIRQSEIDAAQASLDAVSQQLASAEYRSTFYAGLISTDRNGWEIAESIARHSASGVYVIESILSSSVLSAPSSLISERLRR